MKALRKPTSMALVGVLFLLYLSGSVLALQNQGTMGQIDKADAITSGFLQTPKNIEIDAPNSGKNTDAITDGFLQPQKDIDMGKLDFDGDTILYPWASRQVMGMRLSLSETQVRAAKTEEIIMDGDHSSAELKDISAINTIEKRDLRFEDAQIGDLRSQGFVNSEDINILGKEVSEEGWPNINLKFDEIEQSVESKSAPASMERSVMNAGPRFRQMGNYLNIEVSGISVKATNTVEGGTAIATSNIIIEPVQIINIGSAVDDKLV